MAVSGDTTIDAVHVLCVYIYIYIYSHNVLYDMITDHDMLLYSVLYYVILL